MKIEDSRISGAGHLVCAWPDGPEEADPESEPARMVYPPTGPRVGDRVTRRRMPNVDGKEVWENVEIVGPVEQEILEMTVGVVEDTTVNALAWLARCLDERTSAGRAPILLSEECTVGLPRSEP